jgi:hypothetical protein
LHLDQFAKEALRAVEQPGQHVVAAQFVLREAALRGVQGRARDQALVDADGAVHFAAATEKRAQRQMRLHRLAVHLGQLEKDINGLVWAAR